MSSALGPGSVEQQKLSVAGRAQLAREEAARRQEEARRAEEQRRREEQIAAELERERAKVQPRRSDLAFDPERGWVFVSTPAPRADDRALTDFLIQSFKEEKAKAEAAGGTLEKHEVRITNDTGQAEVRTRTTVPAAPAQPAEPIKPVTAPVVEDDFPILTPAPGIRGRNVYEGVTRSGQVETAMIRKERQPGSEQVIVESTRPLPDRIEVTKTTTVMPVSNGEPDFGYAYPVSGRPGVFEEVGPYGQISRTTISSVPSTIREDTGFIVPAPSGGFAEGFSTYFTNIPAGFQKAGEEIILARKSDVKIGAEAEGEALDIGIRGAKDFFTGKEVTAGKEYEALGKRIGENIPYYAGSIAASGLFFVGTLGIGPGVKAAQAGTRTGMILLRGTRRAEVIGKTASELMGIEATGVRAVKVTKAGDLIAMEKGPLRFYTVGKQVSLPFGKKVTVQKAATPDVFAIEKGIGEDVGFVSARTSKAAIITEQLSPAEKIGITEKGIAPAKTDLPVKAEAVTDVYQSEAKVLPRVSVPVVRGTVEKTPGAIRVQASKTTGKVAESRPVGVSITTFEKKDVLGLAKARAREQKLQAAAAKRLGAIPEPTAAKEPFKIAVRAKPAKTSRMPLETVTTFGFDRELQAVGKKAAAAIAMEGTAKESKIIGKIGLGGGASIYGAKAGAIGFGGATGVEKIGKDIVDVEIDVLRYPPATGQKGGLVTRVKDVTSRAAKALEDMGTKEAGRTATNLLSRQTTRSRARLDLLPRTRQAARIDLLPRTTQQARTRQAARVRVAQRTAQRTTQAQRTVQIRQTRIKTPFVPPRPPSRTGRQKRTKIIDLLGGTKTKGVGVKNPFGKALSIKPEGKKRKRKNLLGF